MPSGHQSQRIRSVKIQFWSTRKMEMLFSTIKELPVQEMHYGAQEQLVDKNVTYLSCKMMEISSYTPLTLKLSGPQEQHQNDFVCSLQFYKDFFFILTVNLCMVDS